MADTIIRPTGIEIAGGLNVHGQTFHMAWVGVRRIIRATWKLFLSGLEPAALETRFTAQGCDQSDKAMGMHSIPGI